MNIREKIIDVLNEKDQTSRGELLDIMDYTHPITIAKEISRLEEDKLVEIKKIKKVAYYILTKEGKKRVETRHKINKKRENDLKEKEEKMRQYELEEEKKYTKGNAKEHLENYFSNELYAKILASEKYLTIDLAGIEKYKPQLYDFAYDSPIEFLDAAAEAMDNIDRAGNEKHLEIRIVDKGAKPIPLASINRVAKACRLVVFEGMISTIDKVRPYTPLVFWECKICGERIPVMSDDDILRKPYMCTDPECRNKQFFEIHDKKVVDRQYLTVSERELSISPEEVNGYVSGELVNDIKPDKRKLLSGNIARFYAISEIINPEVNRQKRATAKIVAKIINYEMVEESFADIKLTQKDIEKIKKFSEKKNILSIFARAIDDTLIGSEYTPIKQAIVLQFFGGSVNGACGHHGNIHIAIVGDPGKGKTTFLRNVISFAPKAMYAVGTSATGKGLMAALDINDVTKNKILRPGPFVRCNGGLIGVDECDKMGDDDIQYMGEALQNGTFTYTKAGIHAVLDANTSCLLSANPKYLQFDTMSPIPPQINIPVNIQDRFDLKFLLWDKPDADVDYDLAQAILQNKKPKKSIEVDFVRKYIAYARANHNPTIPDDVNHYLALFYQRFRNSKKRLEDASIPIPITARQVYSLKKLTEASAKMRLSDVASIEDAKIAKKLFMVCMDQLGYDKETGNYDNLSMSYHKLKSLVDKEKKVMEIIQRLSKEDINGASEQRINDELKTYGFDFGVVPGIIEILKNKGEVFSPKRGYIKPV